MNFVNSQKININVIGDSFLNSNTTFKPSLKLKESWFLNGTSAGAKIGFLRDELYDCFKLSLYDNNKEITNINDETICGNWSLCLIELFGSRYSIYRRQNGFEIKYKPLFSRMKNADSGSIKEFQVKTHIAQSHEEIKKLNEDCKCSYISLTNKSAQIVQNKFLLEPTACRFMLLFILAQSYNFTLETIKNGISDIILNKGSMYRKVFKLIPVIGKKLEFRRIEKLYRGYTLFESQYMFSMPLCLSRVVDVANMWDDLYAFYRIDSLNKDVIAKINSLTQLSRTTHASLMSTCMLFIALCGGFVSAVNLYDIVGRLL